MEYAGTPDSRGLAGQLVPDGSFLHAELRRDGILREKQICKTNIDVEAI